MADQNAIIVAASEVRPEDFTVPVYRWIAEAIWSCYSRRIAPTMAAVIDTLQSMGRWSDTTSKNAVTMQDVDLVLEGMTEADIEHVVTNARTVREAAFRRAGSVTVSNAAGLFYDMTMTVTDIQRRVLTTVGHVFDGPGSRDASVTSIADEEMARIEQMTDSELPGVTCGLAWLDTLTGGLLPAEAWVIAGVYKGRKTTLALNMVLASASAGVPVSVFTVGDSSRDSTYRKLLAMMMNKLMLPDVQAQDRPPVSSKTLQYRLRDAYFVQLRERAEEVLRAYPIRLYDGRDLVANLSETGRILRRDAAMHGTRVWIYDYAQAASAGQNDYERTSYISGWTQQLVGELGNTGVIISQLNEDTVRNGNQDSYSPGAKGGGALPAMANVFLTTSYDEPMITVNLKLARDSRMGDKVAHKLNPSSGLILDANKSARTVTL